MYKNYVSLGMDRDIQLRKGKNSVSTTNLFSKSSISLLLLVLSFIGYVPSCFAQTSGIFESYAILSINGGANAYYDMQAATANPDFQGANLGTFSSAQSLVIKGGENKTFKNGGCNINSSSINYRVYLTSTPTGAYTNINEPFNANLANPGDQQWIGTGGATNVLTGLASGNYTVEVYSQAGYDSCGSGTHFSSNLGANYKATFTVCNTTGALTPGNYAIPGCFATVQAAVAYINTNGVTGTGTVQFDIAAGGSETAPAGGISITATGTATTAIRFVKAAGAAYTITAPTTQVAGSLNDAVIKIIGGDFITLDGLTLIENAANLTTAAATNNMTEFGVALFYTTATNGAQNNTIQNCTITLNRTYQNTFGIYANATHTATAVTTSASATGTAGGNSGLRVYSNTISNVNIGIVVLGPTAAADANTGVEIGGAGLGNSITNFGTTGTFSGYANVSGTVNGILIRNSNGFVVSNNTITSSVGGTTVGTLNGIQVAASSATPTATFTNNINSNAISLQSAVTAGSILGISYPSGSASATSTANINSNNFTAMNHTVAGSSGTITFIALTSANLNTSISSNLFTNISCNTTGSVTFISNAISIPTSGGTQTISSNAIVTAFNKTGAGGTITFFTSNASSVTGSIITFQNNNLSNITATGATAFVGINNTDGGSPTKTFTGNTFNNITGGTGTINPMTVNFFGGVSSVSSNTISNITWAGTIAALTIGSSSTASTLTVGNNTITGIASTTGAVTGISVGSPSTISNVNNNNIRTLSSTAAFAVIGVSVSGATTTNVFKNTISDLLGSNASSTVSGIAVSGGTTITLSNNRIGDLRTTAANAANPLNGINITGGTTVNAYFNTVYLNGVSSGALFGSSAISASSTTSLTLNNNLFVNTSTANGAALTVAYRRSATGFAYTNSSDRNDFFASTIFTDGTNTFTAIIPYRAFMVSPRDANAISLTAPFLSTVSGNANFLKINTATATQIESGGANIAGITDDFENDIRFGNAGYAGTGTAPDIGADEFNGTPSPVCTGTPAAATITGGTTPICSGTSGGTLALSTTYTDIGITYQWASSTTSGGPYTTTLGTSASQAVGILTQTTYFVSTITCGNSGLSFTTAQKAIVVNALPTVTLTPSSSSICSPGGSPVTLTASGATTYTYTNNASLTPTTGSPVSANPSSTTTYVVSGTDGNGCIGTASATVNVVATPTGVTATASPATICSGGTSTLTGSGNAALPTTVSAYTFATSTGATLDAMTGATTVIAANTASGGTGDDTPSGVLTLPFTFNFNSTDYTQYSISPDGWIRLGGTAAASEFTNSVASTSNLPKIYPIWDDLSTGTDGNAKVLTTGTSPNRIFKIQWFVTNPRVLTGSANSTVQLWMYEGSNIIEFRYGTVGTSVSASAGMTGGATNFQSITFSSNTASNSTANNAITTPPASGRLYSFTPQSSPLTYAWTSPTNLVSPNSAVTATNALSATETFTLVVSNGACPAAGVSTTVTVSSGAAITTQPVAAVKCTGTTATFTVIATGPGLTYQWYKGASPLSNGGAISGATSAALTITSVTATDAAIYTVTVSSTCGSPVTSNGVSTLTVNPLPTVTVSPTTSTYCTPGGTAVVLTASGASTYAWNPSTGLSATTGTSVNASPSTAQTYTVTGTDVNGCVNTATTSVAVSAAVTLTSVTASPATICSGSNSTLTAVASANLNYTVAPLIASAETPSGSFTNLASAGVFTPTPSGTAATPTDDGYWDNIALPFAFNFYGVTYNTVRISTNCNVQFGSVSGTAGNPGAASWTPNTIPTAGGNLDNFIGGPMMDQDLRTATGGTLRYFVNGTSPNQKFVISYEAAKVFSSSDANTS